MEWFQQQVASWNLEGNMWVLHVFAVVVITLLANLLARFVFARLAKKVEKSKNFWDDAFFEALSKPLSFLIWVIGISAAAEVAQMQSGAEIFDIVDPIRVVSSIFLLAWFVVRFINSVERHLISGGYATEEPVDVTTVNAVSKLLRISVIITGVLVVLQSLGYSISGVLAFGGIGGIAVGFAAKDLLANFFGGLMIYLDRPFTVGDWVRSPDREIEGTVEYIGWRLTRIRTFDQRPLYVPNSIFTTIAVQNPSRMTNRRIFETIGIRYQDGDKMAAIIDRVRTMLESHPDIDTNRTLIVNFTEFGPSSLNFFVYTFTKTTQWVEFHKIKQSVLLDIFNLINDEGAEIAFPTSTIHFAEAEALEHDQP